MRNMQELRQKQIHSPFSCSLWRIYLVPNPIKLFNIDGAVPHLQWWRFQPAAEAVMEASTR